MTRLYVDMDGTLAEFKQVPFEQLYDEGYFLSLKPYSNVISAINMLLDDDALDICILSSYLTNNINAISEKNMWLDKYVPNATNRIFVPYGTSKSNYLDFDITNAYLLDDYNANLKEWQGTGIKCINPINNKKGSWTGHSIRYDENPVTIYNKLIDICK